MKLELLADGSVQVTLSERNLLALLSKVRREGSKRTLEKFDGPEFPLLRVVAEPDAEHYGGRTYPPGAIVHEDDTDDKKPIVLEVDRIDADKFVNGSPAAHWEAEKKISSELARALDLPLERVDSADDLLI